MKRQANHVVPGSDETTGEDRKKRITDHFALKLADLAIRYRAWFLIACVAIAVGAGAGLAKLEVSTNYRVFFSAQNPDLQAFDAFEKTYTKNDNFLFVIKPKTGTVATAATMAVIEEMTKDAWQIPFATRVDSLTNYQHSHAEGDDLIVQDLIKDAAGLSKEQITKRIAIAVDEPLLRDRLISPDMATTGINVTLHYPGKALTEVGDATAAARDLVRRIERAHPNLEVALTGVSALNNAFAEATIDDAGTLFPAMFLALILVIWFIVRSVTGTVATLLVISLSTVTALGAAGWLGITLSPFSGSAPVVILTLALADSVHVLISQIAAMREGETKFDAIKEAIRANFLAVSVTSGTTIVGFLALNFSDAPPFNDLGNIVAIGIAAAWFFSLTFFPAFLALVRFNVPKETGLDRAMKRLLDGTAEFVIRHYRKALVGFVALLIAAMALIPTMAVNDQWVDYFDKRTEFRQDAEFAMDNLTGLYLVEFSVPAAEAGAISDPEYLQTLDRFVTFLRAQPEIQHVHAYTDVIRRLNMNMNGDDRDFYAIPETREAAAQYLLLYELSLPYGLDLTDRVNIDKSATRVTVTLPEISTDGVLDVSKRAEAWMAANGPAFMAPSATGAPILFSHISERNIRDMFSGNLVAILLIAAIMVGALRSLPYGLLSMAPNIVPLVLTFGIWALLVGEIGMAAATVSATSLGIIVDNTVHFLIKYLAGRRKHGLDAEDAVRRAFKVVGPAVLANTVILVLGFGVLAYSTFRVTGQMGTLTALAIFVALFVDFILLPALLLAGQSLKQGVKKMTTFNPKTLTASPSAGILAAVVLSATATMGIPSSSADAADTKAYDIAARADRSDRGFKSSRVTMKMVLRNAAGKETTRVLKQVTFEVADEMVGDKNLIHFQSPADIKGTALLSHAQILDPDAQWLFLPSLKRVKRISSANKSGPFVGSEFAFEDITGQELNKYAYRYMKQAACGDLTCDVLELTPKYKASGYARQIAWIDTTDHQLRKVDFFDRKNAPLKTLEFTAYKKYGGKVWRAHHQKMVNHQTGKTTSLHFGDYEFGLDVTKRHFDKSQLARLR